jgi:hypothetical protein
MKVRASSGPSRIEPRAGHQLRLSFPRVLRTFARRRGPPGRTATEIGTYDCGPGERNSSAGAYGAYPFLIATTTTSAAHRARRVAWGAAMKVRASPDHLWASCD